MKKFLSFLIIVSMILSVFTLPGYASEQVLKIEDSFSTTTLNSRWVSTKTNSNIKDVEILTKEKDGDAANLAAKLSRADGDKQVILNSSNTPTSIKDRLIMDCKMAFEEGTGTFNLFNVYVYNENTNKLVSELKALMTFTNDGTVSVFENSDTKKAITYGAWHDFRVDVDLKTATYRAWLDGEPFVKSNGTKVFSLSSHTAESDTTGINAVKLDTSFVHTMQIKLPSWVVGTMWVDDISWRQAVTPADDGTYFSVSSSTVSDGASQVSVDTNLVYTFNHDIKPGSAKYISLNSDDSLIKSATVNGKVLTLELAKSLSYNREYTLDFGHLEDVYGSFVSHNVTFKTESDYNIITENFDGGKFDTNIWQTSPSGSAIAEVRKDPKNPDNDVMYLYSASKNDGLGDYATCFRNNVDAISIPDEFVLDFSIYFDPASTIDVLHTVYLYQSSGGYNPAILYLNKKTGDVSVRTRGATNGSYVHEKVGTYDINEWLDVTMEFDFSEDKFSIALNGVPTVDANGKIKEYTLQNSTNGSEALTKVDFKSNSYGSKFYMDNIKFGQTFFADPDSDYGFYNASGTKIDEVDADDTVFKASIINRSMSDKKVQLYIAGYDITQKTLESLVSKELTVASNGMLNIEEHIKDLGGLAYTRNYKAFFIEDEETVKPFEADMLLTRSEIKAGTTVVKAYPGGKLKALTFSFDDGKKGEEVLVSKFNQYGMKATFNIVGSRADGGDTKYSVQKENLASFYAGHELANHSYTHSHDKNNPYTSIDQFEEELLKADAVIKEAIGESAVGYVYDNGYIPEDLKDQIANVFKENGYVYGRDNSYSESFKIPEVSELPFLVMTASISSYSYEKMSALADDYLALDSNEMTLFSIWGHNHDFNEANGWDSSYTLWNDFLAKLANKSDIWYATNKDVYSYIAAMDKLTFTDDAIYNSSDINLWCLVGGNPVEIPAGDGYSLDTHEILPDSAPVTIDVTLTSDQTVQAVYPSNTFKAVTLRFDDGTLSDKDVVEALNRNGLKASFAIIAKHLDENGSYYIPGSDLKSVYAGHELVSHSWDHDYTAVNYDNLLQAKELIEKYWGEEVIGYAPPSGNWSVVGKDKYHGYLKQSGHVYATNDFYTGEEANVADYPTSIARLVNFRNPLDCYFTMRMIYSNFLEATEFYADSNPNEQTLFFPFAHAKDFKVYDETQDKNVYNKEYLQTTIDEFAQILEGENIWYATNGEVITYLMAQNTLSVPKTGSSKTVNTTDKTLYYRVGDELITLAPGSTLNVVSK